MKIFCTDRRLLFGKEARENFRIEDSYIRADNTPINTGKYFYQPEWLGDLMYLPVVVLRMHKVAKHVAPEFVRNYCSWYGVGISMFSRKLLSLSLGAGVDILPEAMAYNFDGSLILDSFQELFTHKGKLNEMRVQELREGAKVQRIIEESFLLPSEEQVNQMVSLLSNYWLMKIGDLVLFPMWKGYKSIERGEDLLLSYGEQEVIYFGIR